MNNLFYIIKKIILKDSILIALDKDDVISLKNNII